MWPLLWCDSRQDMTYAMTTFAADWTQKKKNNNNSASSRCLEFTSVQVSRGHQII